MRLYEVIHNRLATPHVAIRCDGETADGRCEAMLVADRDFEGEGWVEVLRDRAVGERYHYCPRCRDRWAGVEES